MGKSRLLNDGERMIPEYHKENIMYGEHLGRYIAVLTAIRGKTVLDIASGSGYGAKLMSEVARYVYGVDINKSAIQYSRQHYSGRNISYKQGDGTHIPIADSTVDATISMETLEHIADQGMFIKEIKRVMRPNGFLVLSTPNKKAYPAGNPYHMLEHDQESLVKLLAKYFKNVEIYHQVVSIAASVLQEDDLLKEDFKVSWELRKDYKSKPNDSIYFLAVCGDGLIPKLTKNTLLSQEYSHLQQRSKDEFKAEAERIIADLNSKLSAEKITAKRTEDELMNIYKSRSWKIARSLQIIKQRVKPARKS